MKRSAQGIFLRFGFVIMVCVMFFVVAIGNMTNEYTLQSKAQLEEVLRKSVLLCYATEGAYPNNLDYLCEHYGLQYDKKRFIIMYEPVAANLMPEMTVLEYEP